MGKFFLREVGNGNVKWMIYEEIALLQYCNIAIRFFQQGEYIINDFILYIIYI